MINKSCKLYQVLMILVGFGVLLAMPIYAVTSQVNSFTGQVNPFNISLNGISNQSFILPLPEYAYGKNITLNLIGYKAEVNTSAADSFYNKTNPFNLTFASNAENSTQYILFDLNAIAINVSYDSTYYYTDTFLYSNVSSGFLFNEGSGNLTKDYIKNLNATLFQNATFGLNSENITDYILNIGYNGFARYNAYNFINRLDDFILSFQLNQTDFYTDCGTDAVCSFFSTGRNKNFEIVGVYPVDADNQALRIIQDGSNLCTTDSFKNLGSWNKWNNITITYNSTAILIYINQVLNKSCSGSTTITNNTMSGYMNFGAREFNAGDFRGGRLQLNNILLIDNTFKVNGTLTSRKSIEISNGLINSVLNSDCVCSGCSIIGDYCLMPFLIQPNITGIAEINLSNYTVSGKSLENTYMLLNNILQWNNTGIFNTSKNVSINMSIVNNALAAYNMLNFTFYSASRGILTINITNSTYAFGIDNCSSSLSGFGIPNNATTLNISFYDDSLLTLLNADAEGIFYYYGYNYSFAPKNINNYKFCSYPNWFNSAVTGQILYSKSGYASKVYNIDSSTTLYLNNQTQNLNLYLTNLSSSTLTKIVWLTNSYISVTGDLYVYKCNGDGSKSLVETTIISSGDSYVNLNLLTTLYSYSVLYNGILYEDSATYSKCHIESSNSISYFITTETSNVLQPIGLYSISCNLTKNGTNIVSMVWTTNPNSALPITGCLEAYRGGINGYINTYTSCVNDTFSINRTIPITGYDYDVRGKIYQGGYSIPCANTVNFYNTTPPGKTFGLTGLFAIAFLILGIALLYAGDDIKMTIGAVISVIVSWILGLFILPWTVISSICAFILIILLVGRSASKR